MPSPKVSIIIPNYNHAQFLEQRLETVFNQSYKNFEVIILDDCSTDNSVEILKRYKEYPKVSHLVINEVNSGSPFKQWKKGIELSIGEYIWIAESDDYCELNFLEDLLKCNYGLIYAQSYDVDEKSNVFYDRIKYTTEFKPNLWKSCFKINGNIFLKKYLLVKNVIPNASAVIFKSRLVKGNTFSKDLLKMRICGDWLFWIKMVCQTDVCFIDKRLNYFRHHKKTTRIHDSLGKKKQRLLEESKIRTYIYKNYKLRNKSIEQQILKKWFGYFKFSQILSFNFKSIKMQHLSWLEFYFFYFKTKLTK